VFTAVADGPAQEEDEEGTSCGETIDKQTEYQTEDHRILEAEGYQTVKTELEPFQPQESG
jgi:hypothetical protein